MEDLRWEGNSKEMYKVILKAIPELLQGGVKKLVASWVKKNEIEVVTEDTVFQVLEDIAPSEARKKLEPILESMRTE